MSQEPKTPKEIAQEATLVIIDQLNNIRSSARDEVADGILYALYSSHRTLQQSFVSAINDVLVEYAVKGYDPRNEASVKFANKVKDIHMTFPYI